MWICPCTSLLLMTESPLFHPLPAQDARSRSRMNFPTSDYDMDAINAEPPGVLSALLGE